MPKFDEETKCHFFNYDCIYPIPKDVLEELLEDASNDDVIREIPAMDDLMCTNCLLATLIEIISTKLK